MFLTQMVIDFWKVLPEEVMETDIFLMFKRNLGRHLNRQGKEERASAGKGD